MVLPRFLKDFASKVLTFNIGLLLATFYYVFTSIIYALMSVVKHSHYQTFADLGIFTQGIWQYSLFKFPFITFHLDRYFLGDHFHPVLVVLAPLFWFFPDERTLLIIQPFIILSTIIPLYLISYSLTKSLLFSLTIIIAFSLYIPLQYTIFYDFHEIIFLPPLFAWAYFFFISNKKKAVAIFLVLILLTKEELGFFVGTFGFYLVIFAKGWRRFGVFWMVLGVIYSLLMVNKIIPAIGGSYLYLNYGESGTTPQEVILNLVSKPLTFLSLFFSPRSKLETLKYTIQPFAYLPLFNPLTLLLSFEQFFTRFIDQRNIIRWTIAYHYSAPMSVLMPLGAIITTSYILKLLPKYKVLVLVFISIVLLVITRVEQINRSAVLLIKRPEFWARDSSMATLDQALSLIPKKASVATQYNLVSHVALRDKVYFLDHMTKASYILADFNPGQSEYNLGGREKWTQSELKLTKLLKTGAYKVIFAENNVILAKKTNQ